MDTFKALECDALKDLRYLAWNAGDFRQHDLTFPAPDNNLSMDGGLAERPFPKLREFCLVINDPERVVKSGVEALTITTKVDINVWDSMTHCLRRCCENLKDINRLNGHFSHWVCDFFGLPITVKSIVSEAEEDEERREEMLRDLEALMRQAILNRA